MEEKKWNVTIQKRGNSIAQDNSYQAEMCSQAIDFIDSSDDIAISIPMETIIKYGYTEDSCYLEVTGGFLTILRF